MEEINPKPDIIRHILKDEGRFPNSSLFLLIYKHVFNIADPEKIESTFHRNNWKNNWRNGIYDFAHYHSNTHEVLGIYEGKARVQFGGPKGITEEVSKGDVIIIPAGVAHQCIEAIESFKCVGAYPDGKDYDIKKGEAGERPQADRNIEAVPLPDSDPVFGEGSYLQLEWEL